MRSTKQPYTFIAAINACRVLCFTLLMLTMVAHSRGVAHASNLIVQTKSGTVQGLNVGSVNQWRGTPGFQLLFTRNTLNEPSGLQQIT